MRRSRERCSGPGETGVVIHTTKKELSTLFPTDDPRKRPIEHPKKDPGAEHVAGPAPRGDVEAPLPLADAVLVGDNSAAKVGAFTIFAPAVVVPMDSKNTPLVEGKLCLTRNPTMLDSCPCCHEMSRTKVRSSPGLLTWLAALVILVLFWPLCWVPLVTTKCKKTEHICVKCNMIVGNVSPCEDLCVSRKR